MTDPLVPSTEKTARFYNDLMQGNEARGILGKDTRYNSLALREKTSVQKYFLEPMKHLVTKDDVVLDFGCGPGTFLSLVAPLCKKAVGIDVSSEFVKSAAELLAELNIQNTEVMVVNSGHVPFPDSSFDVVLFMDVIHHLEDIETNLREVLRLLKPGGRVIIFEPNKLNPLIYAVHRADKNEHGLLKLGTPAKYRKILKGRFNLESLDFNGIVIGPTSKIYDFISATLNSKLLRPILGWLNPKILITARKPS